MMNCLHVFLLSAGFSLMPAASAWSYSSSSQQGFGESMQCNNNVCTYTRNGQTTVCVNGRCQTRDANAEPIVINGDQGQTIIDTRLGTIVSRGGMTGSNGMMMQMGPQFPPGFPFSQGFPFFGQMMRMPGMEMIGGPGGGGMSFNMFGLPPMGPIGFGGMKRRRGSDAAKEDDL